MLLYVVANVHSKVYANVQRQNLHQLPSCRIRPNAQRPTSAHDLFSREHGAGTGRRLAGNGTQASSRLAWTRGAAGVLAGSSTMDRESKEDKQTQRKS